MTCSKRDRKRAKRCDRPRASVCVEGAGSPCLAETHGSAVALAVGVCDRTRTMPHGKRPEPAEELESFEEPGGPAGEDLLTTAEVAKRLKLTRQTVQRLTKHRKLKALRIGRDWRIKRSALEAFLKAAEAP